MTARRARSGAWAKVEPRPGPRGMKYRAYWYLDGRKQTSPGYASSGDAGYVADWVNAHGGQVLTGDPRMLSGEVFEGTPAERAPELEPEPEEPALPTTLGYWLTRWLDWRVSSGELADDGKAYRTQIRRLAPWAELDLRGWTTGEDGRPSEWAMIRDGLTAVPHKPNVVNVTLTRVTSARAMAYAAGAITERISRPKLKGKHAPKASAGIALNYAELIDLFDAIAMDEHREFLEVSLDLGCRPSETQSITGDAIREGTRQVDVIDRKVRHGEPRTVHVSAETFAILARRKARTPAGEPLFPLSLDAYRAGLRGARKVLPLAKRGCRLHDMRHTCGSLMLDEGYSVPAVAARLGISERRVLDTYTHAFDASQQDMADRLASRLADERAKRARAGIALAR